MKQAAFLVLWGFGLFWFLVWFFFCLFFGRVRRSSDQIHPRLNAAASRGVGPRGAGSQPLSASKPRPDRAPSSRSRRPGTQPLELLRFPGGPEAVGHHGTVRSSTGQWAGPSRSSPLPAASRFNTQGNAAGSELRRC